MAEAFYAASQPDDDYEERLRDERRSRDLYTRAVKVHKEAATTTKEAKKTLETIREIYDERGGGRNGRR